jgi:UDP-N-acetylglucosamine--N-acetylmuramyl-(pentapeptide) pyrophosphoryl-undecaprenol N-acetylglucosamine transferase
MNENIAGMFPLEQEDGFPFHHIHAVGSFGWGWMPDKVRANGVDYENCPSIDMREYIYDMPTVMAAADVVIGRAGSATCNEIAVTGTPCILIPSPNVTGNHQEKNARVLENGGGAVVILEKDCTPEVLYAEVQGLLVDEQRREAMSRALHGMVKIDSAERICDIVEELAKK